MNEARRQGPDQLRDTLTDFFAGPWYTGARRAAVRPNVTSACVGTKDPARATAGTGTFET